MITVSRVWVEHARPTLKQMPYDEELALKEQSVTRVFCWKELALSLGLRQVMPSWVFSRPWQLTGIAIVERPTGGGIAIHGSDICIAFVVPHSMQLAIEQIMDNICQRSCTFMDAVGVKANYVLNSPSLGRRINYCLSQPSDYAIMHGSKKMAGFAVRRYPRSWLIQGSLLIRPIPQRFREGMPQDVLHQIESASGSLQEVLGRDLDERELSLQWAEMLKE